MSEEIKQWVYDYKKSHIARKKNWNKNRNGVTHRIIRWEKSLNRINHKIKAFKK